ncbi:Fe-S protein assembly co-chaperone HscB [Buchnera aphidicola]|uniref:Co-chaperone protein HscB n=1 Tax=Buchnera aphidicola (Cinara cf. splendens/pseudotsugae 3390) TaxID=2518980 RepID=A0A451CXC7_9GAMM|nr:Fe-S protein assembly co-chaperone HscB [Buchnera aphidicola]VFP77977.1 Co-chaperone protein HscB [Buchnera aphidicola (Cinara cf. splendens/pseudotsugae 3390)]
MNYFNLFKLSQKFNIDKKKLIKNFYKLQKKYHPDMQKKKKMSTENQLLISIKINQGFNILKNRFTRARYLLKLKTKKILSPKDNNYYQEKTLKKQFKLHEKIQKIKKKSNSYIHIDKFIKKLKIKLILYFSRFNQKIKEKKINYASQIFYRISFIYKIIKKAQNFKNKLIKENEIQS